MPRGPAGPLPRSLTSVPVPAGTAVKGAVLLNSGGAFRFRGNEREGFPVAAELSRLGYQSSWSTTGSCPTPGNV